MAAKTRVKPRQSHIRTGQWTRQDLLWDGHTQQYYKPRTSYTLDWGSRRGYKRQRNILIGGK